MKETGITLLRIFLKSALLICIFAFGLFVFREIRQNQIIKEIDKEINSYKFDSISPVTRGIHKPDTLKNE